jgi:hypothetical protein
MISSLTHIYAKRETRPLKLALRKYLLKIFSIKIKQRYKKKNINLLEKNRRCMRVNL